MSSIGSEISSRGSIPTVIEEPILLPTPVDGTVPSNVISEAEAREEEAITTTDASESVTDSFRLANGDEDACEEVRNVSINSNG